VIPRSETQSGAKDPFSGSHRLIAGVTSSGGPVTRWAVIKPHPNSDDELFISVSGIPFQVLRPVPDIIV
jgi:hypothetical protein